MSAIDIFCNNVLVWRDEEISKNTSSSEFHAASPSESVTVWMAAVAAITGNEGAIDGDATFSDDAMVEISVNDGQAGIFGECVAAGFDGLWIQIGTHDD